MGTTDSNGVYFYEETDPATPLHTLLNTGQQSVSNAVDLTTRIFEVANTTERNALVAERSPSDSRPLFVWRADAPSDAKLEVTTDGTTWSWYPLGLPDTGWVSMTPGAGWSGGSIKYRNLNGMCTVNMSLTKNGTVENTTVSVATLPPSVRPTEDVYALAWMSINGLSASHRVYPVRCLATGVIDISATSASGSLANGGAARANFTFPVG